MRFSNLPVLLLLPLLLGGCICVSPEISRAYLAPVLAVPELSAAIAAYRVTEGRWPEKLPDIVRAAEQSGVRRETLLQIRSIQLLEQSAGTAKYRCLFPGGGSTSLEVKLHLKEAGPDARGQAAAAGPG